MIFGTHQQCNRFNEVMITYNNTQIQRVFVTKYLDMQLDPSLSFQEHVKKHWAKSNYWGELVIY